MKEPMYFLDGYSIIYRSYFAFIRGPLRNNKGENISALYGFFNTLLGMMKKEKSENIIVLLDSKTKTFRHEMYKEYKANRDKTPDELRQQIPLIEDLLHILGVKTLRVDGYEADDLMGTLAIKAKKEGIPANIISGDKDLLQFVEEGIKVLKPDKGQLIEQDAQSIFDSKGVWPNQIIDYLSIVGDAADNIPGVKGVGEKGAAKLLQSYGTLDEIYNNIDKITAKAQKKNLIESKDNAFFSRDLVIIKTDAPVEIPKEDLSLKEANKKAAAAYLLSHGLKALAKELDGEAKDSELVKEAPKKGEYEIVLDEKTLEKWIDRVKESQIVSLDCETDNLDAMQANPVGLSISVKSAEACYIPLKMEGTKCLDESLVKLRLSELFSDQKIKIIGQNFKYDWKVLRRWGLEFGDVYFDTMIAAWMLDAGSPVNMDFLADRYLNYTTTHFKDIVPKGETFDKVPLELALQYAAEDADITFRLYKHLKPLLEKKKLLSLFQTMEMPLVQILAKMEYEGISLSSVELDLFSHELAQSLDLLQKEIYTLCGRKFNINSPKQLQEILFVDRKLTPIKKTKSGYSTDISVLTQLAEEDPVPEKILIYRGLNKLKSTYVDPLPKLINRYTDRIHTNFVQTGTATGRLSSKDPNLQNIPVKDENGRRIRKAFHPKKGYTFVSADYSQIELVVLAHLSKDQGLIDAFKSGVDVHSKTASLIFKVDSSEVTPSQRRIAKTINFGVMYGMSAFRLSNELKIPRGEASGFIDTYFTEYSGIKDFVDQTVEQAETDRGVFTIKGRFRPIPEIRSSNKMEKNGAIRAAVNSRIQGSAADIMKQAMINIDSDLKNSHLEAKVLLQVHDEIILEVLDQDVQEAKELIEGAMLRSSMLDVPLKVSVETGQSWGDIH